MENFCKNGICTAKTMAEFCKCKFQCHFRIKKWCAMERKGICTNDAAAKDDDK